MQLVLDAPFDSAYAMGGPDHKHWIEARDRLRAGTAYDKFAHVANKLMLQDPIYLLMLLGIIEYSGALTQCAAASWSIHQEKKGEKAKDAERKRAAAAGAGGGA